jgi:DUF2934 family protein
MTQRAGKTPATTKKQQRAAPESVEEAIRRRAYELYLERGGAHGSAMDDWLRAEREIPSRQPRARGVASPRSSSR